MDTTLAPAMPKKVRPASEFGERLTALRRARGLTQVQLAEKIGSTQRAISRYERTLRPLRPRSSPGSPPPSG